MQNRAFRIRRASVDDLGGVVDCLHSAFAPFESVYTPEAYADTTLSLSTVHERFATMQILVAIDADSAVVGTISLEKESDDWGHVRGMAVLPAWQGTGVASQLLATAEDELRASGCTSVRLETTEPLQRAMRFYERNGFHRTGSVTDFFGMPLLEYAKHLGARFRAE